MASFFEDLQPQNTAVPATSTPEPAVAPKPNFFSDLKAAVPEQPTMGIPQTDGQPVGTFEAVVDGFNHGMQRFVDTMAAPAGQALFGKNYDSYIKSRNAWEAKSQEAHPTAFDLGQFGGEVAATTPAIMATNPATAGLGLLSKAYVSAGTSALQGAAIGAARTPDPGDSRLDQAKSGALLGGVLGAITPAVGAGLSRTFKLSPETQATMTTADKYNIPVAPINTINSKLTKWVTSTVPLNGAETLNEAQQGKIIPAIKEFTNSITPNHDLQDVQQVITARGNVLKGQVNRAFNDVSSMAKNEKSLVNISDAKAEALNTINSTFSSTLKERATAFSKLPDDVPFDTMREWRSRFGSLQNKLGQDVSADAADKQLATKLYGKTVDSLDTWGLGTENPNINNKYAEARELYRNYASVFKDNPTLRKGMEDSVYLDKYISGLISSPNASYLQKNLGALGEGSSSTIRAYALRDALSKNLKDDVLNVSGFSKSLLGPNLERNQTFWGPKYDEIKGFGDMLDHLYSQKSNTGFGYGAGTVGLIANPAAAVTYGIPVWGFARLMNSPKVLDLARKWSRVTDNVSPNIRNNMVKEADHTVSGISRSMGFSLYNEMNDERIKPTS